jgi:hypothetical protein
MSRHFQNHIVVRITRGGRHVPFQHMYEMAALSLRMSIANASSRLARSHRISRLLLDNLRRIHLRKFEFDRLQLTYCREADVTGTGDLAIQSLHRK